MTCVCGKFYYRMFENVFKCIITKSKGERYILKHLKI